MPQAPDESCVVDFLVIDGGGVRRLPGQEVRGIDSASRCAINLIEDGRHSKIFQSHQRRAGNHAAHRPAFHYQGNLPSILERAPLPDTAGSFLNQINRVSRIYAMNHDTARPCYISLTATVVPFPFPSSNFSSVGGYIIRLP